MHRMRTLHWTLLAALAAGCSFDSGGGGDSGTEGDSDGGSGTDTSDATSASASASASATDSDSAGSASSASGTTGDSTTAGTSGGSATTGDPTATGGGTTGPGTASATTTDSTTDSGTTGDPTTGGSTGGGGTTSGGVVCEPAPTVADLYWVKDAIVAAPMQTSQSQSLPGMPLVAYSEVADEGTVTFEVDVPCDDDFRVWGLVWDRWEGTQNPSNADSLYFNVDGSNEVTWAYGCETWNQGDGEWAWILVASLDGNQCPNSPDVRNLTAGSHHLNFRNREEGDVGEQNMAAIAAIAVTNDPGYDPNTDYQP